MLNTDDPDQVDKAMKAAWQRMAQQDQQFTAAAVHTVRHIGEPQAPHISLSQKDERTNRMFAAFGSEHFAYPQKRASKPHSRRPRLMLNQRRATMTKVTGHSKFAPQTKEMQANLARLPAAAELDAEASMAENADF